MRVFLMFKDRDFNLSSQLPPISDTLLQDLEINTLLNAMALKDDYLFDIAKKTILSSLNDIDAILYRQDILKDCLKNPSIVREIYQIPIISNEKKHKRWLGIFSRYPAAILNESVQIMQLFVDLLRHLRQIADEHADKFDSEGFQRFFNMLKTELDDEFFTDVEAHLVELKFRDGTLISAELGNGNEGTNYVLRKPKTKNQHWFKKIFSQKNPTYTFYIADRDEAGSRALSELKDRGIILVANAVAQSVDHIDSFFKMLQGELAFYIGCLNLYDQLNQLGEPITFPIPAAANERKHSFVGLYDISLALTMKQKIVGNDINLDQKDLIIVTGANQGGKSTFLRSIGLAQLMMQCGMYVPAESFSANLCEGLFTHYKRKEDASMKSGKLDEELVRMSILVENMTKNSMVLFNESFSATNEREGSEIARQIIRALLEAGVKVVFVTHQYDFAHSFYSKKMPNAIFLRAERQADGKRSFKIYTGKPLETSFGVDVYKKVFGIDS